MVQVCRFQTAKGEGDAVVGVLCPNPVCQSTTYRGVACAYRDWKTLVFQCSEKQGGCGQSYFFAVL